MKSDSKFRLVTLLSISALTVLLVSTAQAQVKSNGSGSMFGGGPVRTAITNSGMRTSSTLARTSNVNKTTTSGGNSDPLCRRRDAADRCKLDRLLEHRTPYQSTVSSTNLRIRAIHNGNGDVFGYEDGLRTGAHDAFRGKSYDPQRSHFFKSGVPNGSTFFFSDTFKQTYRDGFLRGYEEGYRNYQSYFVTGKFRR